MQRAVGTYLVVSTILAFAVFFAAEHELRQVFHDQLARSLSTTGSRVYSPAEINRLADQSMRIGLVSSALFGILAVAIGVLTLRRRTTWLLVVDMILTGFGIIGLISALASPPAGRQPLQSGFSLLESAVATMLFLWMLVGLVRYGPWAEENVPAEL